MRVMIAGGTSGIGLALARHYLDAGATVAVCGRDLGRIPEAVAARPQLHAYQLDVAERAALASAIDEFAQAGLDLLIVTAGSYFRCSTRMKPCAWWAPMSTA